MLDYYGKCNTFIHWGKHHFRVVGTNIHSHLTVEGHCIIFKQQWQPCLLGIQESMEMNHKTCSHTHTLTREFIWNIPLMKPAHPEQQGSLWTRAFCTEALLAVAQCNTHSHTMLKHRESPVDRRSDDGMTYWHNVRGWAINHALEANIGTLSTLCFTL